MTTLREYGPWIDVRIARSDLAAVQETSASLKETMGLSESPLQLRVVGERVQLRACAVAGLLQVRDQVFEIAPKFLASIDGNEWRDAFLAILTKLGRATLLPRITGGRSQYGLPDLMGMVIDDALHQAASEGLPRRYQHRTGALSTVRGQIIPERLWHRMIQPDRIECRFDEFTTNTAVARLLKWAAHELASLVSLPWLSQQLLAHAAGLSRVDEVLPPKHVRDALVIPPQYAYLDEAVSVAGMLADGEFLTLARNEESPVRAYLWKTSTVFEDFVFMVCGRAAFELGASCTKGTYALAVTPEKRRPKYPDVPTEPDIVIHDGQWVAVMDAKYKTFRQAPSSENVYQVLADGMLLGSRASALVYPAHGGFQRPRTWRVRGLSPTKYIHAIPVDLTLMARPEGFAELVAQMNSYLEVWRQTQGVDVLRRQLTR